jgi:glycosyltransferase involved in cell wall biosynthesis
MASSLPLTALVSSHNEGPLLGRCLDSIAFCDEIIVIDIDSNDDTQAVARAHGAEVLHHAWVPIAEHARVTLAGRAKHDWLLFLDPDEVFAAPLAAQLAELMPTLPDDVGVIDCPWQFYFRNRPLRGTMWGGVNRKRTVVRRDGADLASTVHSGTHAKAGFRALTVDYSGDNAIAHYWAPGYRALVEKHWRYLKLEGPDRMSQGLVTGVKDIVRTPIPAFWESFVRRDGYRDGVTGLLLSVLWSAYTTGAKVALLRELRRARSDGGTVARRG